MKKKSLYVLLTALVLVTLSLPTVYADDQKEAQISLSSQNDKYNIDDTVEISVEVNKVDDLYALQFQLHYDEQALSLKKVVPGKKGKDWSPGYENTDSIPGTLSYIGSQLGAGEDLKNNAVIVTFEFTPLKEGETKIELDRVEAANSQATKLNLQQSHPIEITIR